jgi:peptide/nickel transport system substrate-binding protein
MPSSQGVRFLLAAAGALYDPGKAKQLLAAAGFPKGFDAGHYYCDSSYANIGEAVVNNLLAVGIRSQLRPVERAAFIKEYSEKKYRNINQAGPGAFGNAATRIEAHLVKGGVFSYGYARPSSWQ